MPILKIEKRFLLVKATLLCVPVSKNGKASMDSSGESSSSGLCVGIWEGANVDESIVLHPPFSLNMTLSARSPATMSSP